VHDVFGLDEITLAAYRLWLRSEDLTIEEVAATLGCPASQARRARDRLVEMSLLLESWERPGRVVAVHPEAALEQFLRSQHDQLLRRQEALARARAQLSGLVAEYVRGRRDVQVPVDVARMDSVDAARAHVRQLVGQAEKEVLWIVAAPQPAQVPPGKGFLPEARAVQRGVSVRGIYSRSALADEATLRYGALAAAQGAEIRVVDYPPMSLVAVDRHAGLVTLDADERVGGALLVRGPTLANLLVTVFEAAWGGGEPWEGDRGVLAGGRGEAGPTDQERALLQVLSLGVKDEAAARHLGVSVRTLRRMTADLMSRLGARSRFQAGVLAARRGWI
jgi:sugar-specific transcriptional regulator TrmB/DNA-binding CsgD family transcriptional regulator